MDERVWRARTYEELADENRQLRDEIAAMDAILRPGPVEYVGLTLALALIGLLAWQLVFR